MMPPLTTREYQVFALLAEGKTYRTVGAELGIGFSTVKAHVQHILAKRGGVSIIHALLAEGWLRPPTTADLHAAGAVGDLTAAIERARLALAELEAERERAEALLRTPRSDDVASEQSDGVVAVTAESSPIWRAA